MSPKGRRRVLVHWIKSPSTCQSQRIAIQVMAANTASGNKRVSVNGSFEAAQSWRTKLAYTTGGRTHLIEPLGRFSTAAALDKSGQVAYFATEPALNTGQ